MIPKDYVENDVAVALVLVVTMTIPLLGAKVDLYVSVDEPTFIIGQNGSLKIWPLVSVPPAGVYHPIALSGEGRDHTF